MSDVSLELSGGQPQQLDSLITNFPWTGDTERLRDIDLCTPTGEMACIFNLWMHAGAPFRTPMWPGLQQGRFTIALLKTSVLSVSHRRFYLVFLSGSKKKTQKNI